MCTLTGVGHAELLRWFTAKVGGTSAVNLGGGGQGAAPEAASEPLPQLARRTTQEPPAADGEFELPATVRPSQKACPACGSVMGVAKMGACPGVWCGYTFTKKLVERQQPLAATIAAAEVLKDVDISQLSGSELSALMRTGRVPSAPGNTGRLDLSARPRKDAVAKAAGGGAPRREKTPPGTPPGPPPSKRSRSLDVAKSAKRPVVAAAEAAGSPEAATGSPRLLMRDLAAFLEGRPAAVQQAGWRARLLE